MTEFTPIEKAAKALAKLSDAEPAPPATLAKRPTLN